ncbi:MAG TPA: pyridoxal-dependent decarboxylase, partial [Abditibacteriaceae bacterium]
METAQNVLREHCATQPQPYSGASPAEIDSGLDNFVICPENSEELGSVLHRVGAAIVRHGVVVSHPACIAHLHCAPLIPALAAELLISATNQSMDSWDQSAAATHLEERMVDWMCDLYGYGAAGSGTFTSGGTQSNFMGMLMARDWYARKHLNWNIQEQGLPPEATRFRILCSTASHFTIRQAAALLGLGEQAVVAVETDASSRLDPIALEREIARLKQENLLPIALVATAGTTDFGSIDPMPEMAECARTHGLWFHVDAAYG